MRWYLIAIVLTVMMSALLWGCAGTRQEQRPVRGQIAVGDRQKDWALVYYQSWRRAGKPTYLRLARRRMADAIVTYFQIQVKIGHSFPDFYIVDRKRRESCRFLDEMDRDAGKFRVLLDDTAREGCLR